jgi:glutamate transport system permease protein
MSDIRVLFDAPGPRARRRHAVLSVLATLLFAGLVWLAMTKLAAKGQLHWRLWQPFFTATAWRQYLLPGLENTFKAAGISIVLAGVFGLMFGVGRLSPLAPVRWVCGIVVEFFRAVPVLILMIFAFGLYARNSVFSSGDNALAAVVTGLALYNGAVVAELVRAGVHALPKGQAEGGLSIGLTRTQTLVSIQLPQALTAMLPALVGQFVVVLKDSALGYQITYLELLLWSKTLGSAYANTLPAYLVAAVLFVIINSTLTALARYLERWLRSRGRPALRGGTALPAPPALAPVPAPAEGRV